jgi:GNAT superfamily N-acetyltransferase
MSDIRYIQMRDETHAAAVVEMMRELYHDSSEYDAYDTRHFPETVRTLIARPEVGRIFLFMDVHDAVQGYALLIPYFSNEFGGFVVFVDELFVAQASRRRGLARGLFDFIECERPFNARAILLEVLPSNAIAMNAYKHMGFKPRVHETMVRTLGAQAPEI